MRRMATLGAVVTDEEACFTIMNNEHVDLGIVATNMKKKSTVRCVIHLLQTLNL